MENIDIAVQIYKDALYKTGLEILTVEDKIKKEVRNMSLTDQLDLRDKFLRVATPKKK